jgi:MoaA/NifB/PqqE/SkfB family radical SAM enzyme
VFSTTPVDVVRSGAWLLSYRYEPFLDRWFIVRPDAAAELQLVETADVPARIRAAALQTAPTGTPLAGGYAAPTKVQIQLNRHCNYACSICYANSYKGQAASDDLTLPELVALFANLKAWGVCRVNFVGGEVFMRKDFADIVAAAHKARLLASCITNARIPGQRLDKYESLLRSLFNVQVSCNGIGASYENEYGTDSWDKARQCIANVLGATKANILSYVISEANCEDIPRFLEFASQVRPRIIKFGSVCWSGRSERARALEYYRRVLPRAKQLIAEGRERYPTLQIQCQLDLGEETPLWEDYSHGYRPLEFYFAPEGRDGVYIGGGGDVYPFPLLSDRPEFNLGNIRRDDVRAIWNSHPLLKKIRAVTFAQSACGRLGCKTVCGLWSRAYAISWSGLLDGKVPCELTDWQAVENGHDAGTHPALLASPDQLRGGAAARPLRQPSMAGLD